MIERYLSQNAESFTGGRAAPGDRVLERDSGRLGTVLEGGTQYSAAFHPAVEYDDEPGVRDTSHGTSHFAVLKPGVALPPFPWAA